MRSTLSERDIVARYFSRHVDVGVGDDAGVDVGVGDDAAVVTPPEGAKMVVTTDTLNEGIHFHADHSPEHLGHKALAASLSDLASMGAAPLWATINLSLPNVDHQWLEGFANGLYSLAERYDVKVIGGDTVKGRLSVSLQAIGYLKTGEVLTRAGAKPGDLIYVSGTVGDAAMGLALQPALKREQAQDEGMPQTDVDYFVARFHRPEPRVALGMEIVKYARAAIDISDGLLMDLRRLLSASGTGAVIDVGRVPLSSAMRRRFEGALDWSVPLTGGEDYELVFTADKGQADKIRQVGNVVGCPVTEIGRVVESGGEGEISLMQDGSPMPLPDKLGFDHFA